MGAESSKHIVTSLPAGDSLKSQAIATVEDETSKLTHIWQTLLNVEPIRPDENYFDLGGDSSLAVRLFSRIEDEFKIKLPLATLFDAPTIGELTQVLHSELVSNRWSSAVSIQSSGSRPPFFCIHGAGGNVLIYRELSKHLGPDQPFYGLQAQGLDGTSDPLSTIEEMASLYVKEIRKISPHGPYFIGGYCMGGTVAYEVAQQLQAGGEEIALLGLFDTMNWCEIGQGTVWERGYQAFQRFIFHLANFLCLDLRGMLKFSQEKLEDLRERIPVWVGILLGRVQPGRFQRTMAESRNLGRLWLINDRACLVYKPRPFAGKVTDFRPRKQYRRFSKPGAKWAPLARDGEEIVVVPVYPAGMLVEPFVKHLAKALKASLDQAMVKCNWNG